MTPEEFFWHWQMRDAGELVGRIRETDDAVIDVDVAARVQELPDRFALRAELVLHVLALGRVLARQREVLA